MTSPGSAAGAQEEAITAVAVLGEDVRRRLYLLVRAAHRPVGREEAAAAAGISRKLAAFHLDKLVSAGLLRARYDPPPGLRRVGRTPKTYEPAGPDITVSIPPRHHDVLAGILADAVLAERDGESARSAAARIAADRGRELGAAERARARPGRLGAERALTLAAGILAGRGYEPQRDPAGGLRLCNCPFHPLAARAPGLVCAVNHAYLAGLLAGLGADTVTAVLDPRPGSCCVRLAAAGR
ncbi:MAG: transcriptional regulator [Gemmatimonadota bacterium]